MKSDQRSYILSTDQGWRSANRKAPCRVHFWALMDLAGGGGRGSGPWEVVSQSLSFHHQRFVFPVSGLKPCHLV